MVHHFFGASVLERTTNVATGSDKAYLVKHSYSASGLKAEIKSLPSQTTNWQCGCQAKDSALVETPNAKAFGRYVDDILRSAKVSNIDRKLEEVSNNLHPNLEFTIETLNDNSMPFLDMEVQLLDPKMNTSWYQKHTDTGLILQFRALAPVKYRKNITEGTMYRIFNATSTWETSLKALKERPRLGRKINTHLNSTSPFFVRR